MKIKRLLLSNGRFWPKADIQVGLRTYLAWSKEQKQ